MRALALSAGLLPGCGGGTPAPVVDPTSTPIVTDANVRTPDPNQTEMKLGITASFTDFTDYIPNLAWRNLIAVDQ